MTGIAGKKRSFGRGLGLVIITFGLYQCYWWYKAFKEVYAQERKEFPEGLYWCFLIPIVNIFTIIAYGSRVLRTLNEARAARNLPPTLGIGTFILWSLLPLAGAFIAYWKVQGATNEYWDAAAATAVPLAKAPPMVAA